MGSNPNKKTILIRQSNQDLIQQLQNEVEIIDGKHVTRTAIINVAVAELFNKKKNIDTINYEELRGVLKCYNII
jgi:hypothetical protein